MPFPEPRVSQDREVIMRRTALSAAFCLLAGAGFAQDRATIDKLNDAFVDALGRGDFASVAKMYTEDAYLMPPGADLVRGRVPSSALPGPVGESLLLPGANVAPSATVHGGTTVGAGATVAAGAVVEGCVLFDGASVAAGARLRDSVIGRNAIVGEGTVLDGVVVGDGVLIGAANELLTGVRVFPGMQIEDGAIRFSSDR